MAMHDGAQKAEQSGLQMVTVTISVELLIVCHCNGSYHQEGTLVQAGLPRELLYADDLILLPDSEAELREKIVNWKAVMEVNGGL